MSPTKKTLQTQIDDNLRRIFEEDARADLPEQLLDLLDRLDKVAIPEKPAPGNETAEDATNSGVPK